MMDLERLADAIKRLNAVSDEITAITGRPANRGITGEFIASHIFDIQLHESAAAKDSDGVFISGPLAGNEVNIKWYAYQEGLLDLKPDTSADLYYLILTGDQRAATSSRGKAAHWTIHYVYLFHGVSLRDVLKQRKVKLGIATSVYRQLWENAEVHPNPRCSLLTLNQQQKDLLVLFG